MLQRFERCEDDQRSAPVGGKDVPTALPALGSQLYSTNSNIGKAQTVSPSDYFKVGKYLDSSDYVFFTPEPNLVVPTPLSLPSQWHYLDALRDDGESH